MFQLLVVTDSPTVLNFSPFLGHFFFFFPHSPFSSCHCSFLFIPLHLNPSCSIRGPSLSSSPPRNKLSTSCMSSSCIWEVGVMTNEPADLYPSSTPIQPFQLASQSRWADGVSDPSQQNKMKDCNAALPVIDSQQSATIMSFTIPEMGFERQGWSVWNWAGKNKRQNDVRGGLLIVFVARLPTLPSLWHSDEISSATWPQAFFPAHIISVEALIPTQGQMRGTIYGPVPWEQKCSHRNNQLFILWF